MTTDWTPAEFSIPVYLPGGAEPEWYGVPGEVWDIWGIHDSELLYELSTRDIPPGETFLWECGWSVTHLPTGRNFGRYSVLPTKEQARHFVSLLGPLTDWDDAAALVDMWGRAREAMREAVMEAYWQAQEYRPWAEARA